MTSIYKIQNNICMFKRTTFNQLKLHIELNRIPQLIISKVLALSLNWSISHWYLLEEPIKQLKLCLSIHQVCTLVVGIRIKAHPIQDLKSTKILLQAKSIQNINILSINKGKLSLNCHRVSWMIERTNLFWKPSQRIEQELAKILLLQHLVLSKIRNLHLLRPVNTQTQSSMDAMTSAVERVVA